MQHAMPCPCMRRWRRRCCLLYTDLLVRCVARRPSRRPPSASGYIRGGPTYTVPLLRRKDRRTDTLKSTRPSNGRGGYSSKGQVQPPPLSSMYIVVSTGAAPHPMQGPSKPHHDDDDDDDALSRSECLRQTLVPCSASINTTTTITLPSRKMRAWKLLPWPLTHIATHAPYTRRLAMTNSLVYRRRPQKSRRTWRPAPTLSSLHPPPLPWGFSSPSNPFKIKLGHSRDTQWRKGMSCGRVVRRRDTCAPPPDDDTLCQGRRVLAHSKQTRGQKTTLSP